MQLSMVFQNPFTCLRKGNLDGIGILLDGKNTKVGRLSWSEAQLGGFICLVSYHSDK